MSANNFIPVVWSARLLQAYYKNLVYGQPGVVNRDYEGEIADAGDTVKINSIGDPTIFDYVKNTDMPEAEVLDDATRSLLIDASKGFNFGVDDIDKRQALGDYMSEAIRRAGYRMKDTMDKYIGSKMAAGAEWTIGSTGSPISIDNSTHYLYDQLVKASVLLDEANVPSDDRWAIVPAWAVGSVDLDSRFIGTRGYDANSVLLNGAVGQAAGFNVLKSNNVPASVGNWYQILCGTSDAFTLAEQINKVEAYRPEKRHGDAVKGLHVYGGKVIRSYALAVVTVNDGLSLAGSGPEDLPA